ncbi:MAG: TatD family hydrolase [Bacteroidia bacterium]|nr:TatD family hydrolase [Bacteroidia bacterium]
MQLIDTHSHLYSSKFSADVEEVISRAKEVNSHVFLPNVDLDSIPQMLDLTGRDPGFFFPMMGLHPCHAFADYQEVLDKMRPMFEERKYYGVGETGLDYYWDKTFIPQQKEALRIQIEWAKEMDLPLILHCRESMDDVIELVREGQDGRLKGIFHCFNGDARQAGEVIDLNFMVGIGGILTYKANDDLREIFKNLPLDHIVLETDSPYLPPVPFRGKRNESSYTKYVGEKLAEIREISFDQMAAITSENALKLFGLI